MDTSKEYIKMCDNRFLRDNWKLAEGDFFTRSQSDLVYCLEKGELDFIKQSLIPTYKSWIGNKIPLFRQDQLQEMVKHRNMFELHRAFNYWLNRQKNIPNSMERLWLAFVMKEKFNKVWNGETWGADL